MKKIIIGAAIFGVLAFAGLIVARLTNVLQFFTHSTWANYPTINKGEFIITSNLVKPKQLDFIVYLAATIPNDPEEYAIAHRVIALEYDTISILNSVVFVNGKSVDAQLQLAHNYILSQSEFERWKEQLVYEEYHLNYVNPDSVVVHQSDSWVKKYLPHAYRQYFKRNDIDFTLEKFGGKWTANQLGPIVVPKDHYFVLGDNRDASMDSRYLGFIPKEKYLGTVLLKH